MSDNKNISASEPVIQYVMGQYPVGYHPVEQHNDEIDLKDVILGLWSERWLIVLIASAVASIALLYALLATPYYKAQAKLRPVPSEYLMGLNNTKVYNLSSEEAFQEIFSSLDSLAMQRAFFSARKDLFGYYLNGKSEEQAFAAFLNDGFGFTLPDDKKDKGKGPFITISYVAPEGVSVAEVVDQYIGYVLGFVKDKTMSEYALARNSMLQDSRIQLAIKSTQLKTAISTEMAKLEEADQVKVKELQDKKAAIVFELEQKRLNRIALLNEHLAIAKKMGIETPQTISSFAARNTQTGTILAEINDGNQPLFLMGSKALTAEIETLSLRKEESIADSRIAEINRQLRELESNRKAQALEKRIGDERFFYDIDSLKAELFRLESLPSEFLSLRLVEVSDPAYISPAKVKPKRSMIVILGIVLGGMLGVIVAIVRRLFK